MKKIFTSILLLILLLSSLVVFIACDGCDGDETPVLPPKYEETVETRFSFTNKIDKLEMGEEYTLLTDFSYVDGEKLAVTSSDESVISIKNNSVLVANKVGKATVTGKYANKEDSFEVEVINDGYLPELNVKAGIQAYNYIEANQQLSFEGQVVFKGKVYSDAEINYQVNDPTFAEIDESGRMTAKDKYGEFTVTISAKWRGFEGGLLTRVITLNVTRELIVTLNNGEEQDIKMFAKQITNEQTTYDLTGKIRAVYDGQEKPFTLEVINNQEGAVSFNQDTGVLSANKYGYASLKVTVDIGGGEKRSATIRIACQRSTVNVSQNVKLFSQADGIFDGVDEVITDGKPIVEAYQDGKKLTVEDGSKVLGVTRSDDSQNVEICNVALYTENCIYNCKFETYTKVLRNSSDLSALYNSSQAANIRGSYIVGNNIIYTTSDVAPNPHINSSFCGLLDGNGKTIEYAVSQNGLFGTVGAGAEIKNLKLVVKKVENLSATAGTSILATNIMGVDSSKVKISDVNASYEIQNFAPDISSAETGFGLIGGTLKNCDMTRVRLDISTASGVQTQIDSGTAKTFGLFGTSQEGSNSFSECKIISGVPYVLYKVDASGAPTSLAFAASDNENPAYTGATANKALYTGLNREEATVYTQLGDVLYSTLDNDAVLPNTNGQTVVKITPLDEFGVYYDTAGGYRRDMIPQANTTSDSGNEVSVLYASVLLHSATGIIGQANLYSYAHVISTDTDLAQLATAGVKYGYWIVANDITYNAATYEYHRPTTTTIFAGLFDGNGKTIEYKVGTGSYGLFNRVYTTETGNTAIVKDGGFVVKGFEDNPTVSKSGVYSILGQMTGDGIIVPNKGATDYKTQILNVYGKYDGCTLELATFNGDGGKNNIGLFGGSSITNYNTGIVYYGDSILDLSAITLTKSDGVYFVPGANFASNLNSTINSLKHGLRVATGYDKGLTVIIPDSNQPVLGYKVCGYVNSKILNAFTDTLLLFAENDRSSYEAYKTANPTCTSACTDTRTCEDHKHLYWEISKTNNSVTGTAYPKYFVSAKVSVVYKQGLFRYSSYTDINGKIGDWSFGSGGVAWVEPTAE